MGTGRKGVLVCVLMYVSVYVFCVVFVCTSIYGSSGDSDGEK